MHDLATDPAPLTHSALEPRQGRRLGDPDLSDRRRIAVLLQGTAVLAHLRHAGRRLRASWTTAVVDDDGRLGGLEAARGGDPMPTVERLHELVALLFGTVDVAGRGEARRAARRLLARWRTGPAGVDPDRAVADVLAAAPFLWEPAFAEARRALGAARATAAGPRLWVCGPGPARRRLLAAAADLAALRDLLACSRARELWEAEASADPSRLAAEGRLREAVAAFAARPPRTAAEKLELARCLVGLGRWESAWELVARGSSVASEILALRCAVYLARLRAARGRLARLEARELDPEATLEVASLAARLLANLGEVERAGSWVERARRSAATPRQAYRAALVAAEVAWDRGDRAAMEAALREASPLREDSEEAWRWHAALALAGMAGGDGAAVVAAASDALRASRRRIAPVDAAALWNDLAVGRVQLGDLAGAERACAHQARLLAGAEGARRDLLALCNLAEVRLRRGRTLGVRTILERALARNRQEGNQRAAAQDAALWARWELVHGRALAALTTCRDALGRLETAGSSWHRDELTVLAGRALGWLGRGDEARECLSGAAADSLSTLEAEERPALLAHAGDRERALAVAEGPSRTLWVAALTGEPLPSAGWDEVAHLEPFRCARLVWDLEHATPGSIAPDRIRDAVAVLRRIGTAGLAERLEERLGGVWEAVAAFLSRPHPDGDALHRLFAPAGAATARLVLVEDGCQRILLDGPGGEEEQAARCGAGVLVLSAPRLDPMLRGLFQLVRRHLPSSTVPAATPATPAAVPGFVGDSPALRGALAALPPLAAGEMPVLVLGESGTGKELVARQIHAHSSRREGPFVPMNCAAVSEHLILSDLFGHVRGSFTGADRDRAGVFETARGGTVFLDEIGDLPLPAQGMLLRVLQEKEIRRVGESLARKVDVRVVAATHRDLAAMVEEGGFRRDLFFRLKVAVITLPPLRDRGDDVIRLAEHFLRRRRGADGGGLTPEAHDRLRRHRWPGNVRELENVLEVACALAGEGPVGREHLPLEEAEPSSPPLGDYHERVEAFRRSLVVEALRESGGRQAEAARRLGLTRQALSYLVRQLAIKL